MSEVKRYRINWHMEETYPSAGAAWMPFQPLGEFKTSGGKALEVVHISESGLKP